MTRFTPQLFLLAVLTLAQIACGVSSAAPQPPVGTPTQATETLQDTLEPTGTNTPYSAVYAVFVTTAPLNVRKYAGEENQKVRDLPVGSVVTIYATVTVADGGTWGMINPDEWVNVKYLQEIQE